ncbi:response regulator [Dorea longicatena]|jgi:CheY-like chemotaxis protein|nr:response regulator [Dorea longicatena]
MHHIAFFILTIPIIAMIANAFSDDQKKARDAGMNGFIAKPINATQMFRTIQKIIKRESV